MQRSESFALVQNVASLLCFDALRVSKSKVNLAFAWFVRSESFFPIPSKKGCKKITDPFSFA